MPDSSVAEAPAPALKGARHHPTRRYWILASAPVLVAAVIWGINLALVGNPVSSALEADSRNSGYTIHAHYGYYVDPTTLILDLSDASHASAIDLFRGIFQSADALHGRGRTFRKVVLANRRKEIFLMDCVKFDALGSEFGNGENPVYMIRTLPENLLLPDGTHAFGRWEGGVLGVLTRQMTDVSEVARAWAEGRPPTRQQY